MVAAGFVATVVVMALACYGALRRALIDTGAPGAERTAATFGAGLVAWLVISGAVAASGAIEPTGDGPPRFLLLLIPAAVATLALAASPFGGIVARRTPLARLVGMQAFRVPVELVLFGLHREGLVPVHMTFEGRNFDILTGLTAALLGVALLVGRAPRALVWLWNLAGLALLVNIVTIAFLSAPGPLRSLDGPPNLVPTTFPYVWLPVFLVQLALLGHLLVLRKLAAPSRVEAGAI